MYLLGEHVPGLHSHLSPRRTASLYGREAGRHVNLPGNQRMEETSSSRITDSLTLSTGTSLSMPYHSTYRYVSVCAISYPLHVCLYTLSHHLQVHLYRTMPHTGAFIAHPTTYSLSILYHSTYSGTVCLYILYLDASLCQFLLFLIHDLVMSLQNKYRICQLFCFIEAK